jgi:amino acid transporter
VSTDNSGAAARPRPSAIPKVVVLTTVMLTFISFWRAAAVVLSDLASTAYYIGGIAEEAIGKSAPWFILFVMLFSYAVRSVYVESCSMFVRGGVYRIVKEAMGGMMAKISVSALMFDYALTGPISSVSAGQYLHGLFNNACQQILHMKEFPLSPNLFAVLFAVSVTVYFWWLNIKGIEESSDKALKILKITTVMAVLVIVWSLITMYLKQKNHIDGGIHLPPMWPAPNDMKEHTLGWLHGIPWVHTFGLAVFLVAFGHSILAMSGEETLAQIYREIEAPKHRNLMSAGLVIFVFSMVLTSFVSFASVMIIPDATRAIYRDNLLNGLVLHMIGPETLKLVLQVLVVAIGALLLSGAVNTAIIGSNGVLNRVAEDGILDDWFRQPHRRYGTTYRIINLIAIIQIATILISRGKIYVLGEAYAFGVVWSFTFMGLAMLMLRWKYKGERGWKVPLNFHVRGKEIPVGLGLVVLILLAAALTNLLTKKVATISGVSFTAGFFVLFTASEWHTHRKRVKESRAREHKEKFILERKTELTPASLELPEGRRRILIPVRDPGNLSHLKQALEEAHENQTELIVMTIKVEKGDASFHHVFTGDEDQLFTNVVALAEKYGEEVYPIVVPSNNSWFAIARTAMELEVNEILLGKSNRMSPDIQMAQLALMWGMVAPKLDRELTLRIVAPGEEHVATI